MSDSEIIPSLLNGTPFPQLVIGDDERISFSNAPARELLGRATAARHYISALRQPALLDAIERVFSRVELKAEAPFQATQAGREVTFRTVIASIGGRDSRSLLLTFIDMSDVQDAVQMRRDFVANVSHELRTPLTALMGFIETLRGAARSDPAAQERFLTIMEREAGRMNRLVQDLLSLSRVEAQERVQPSDAVDLAEIVASSLGRLAAMAAEADITIDYTAAADKARVRGDAHQLDQVVSNLVENAIKYGGSRIIVKITHEDPHPALRGPAVTLSIEDDGEGIDDVHIPRLTERFYRVDSHRSREQGGTGLGLAIVKHIVNRHRGRLRVDSAPGVGSRFSVILPAA